LVFGKTRAVLERESEKESEKESERKRMLGNRMKVTSLIILALSLFITSCASTKLTSSWIDEGNHKALKHPMIIAISDSQQTRQVYENHFVSELKSKGITSTASYTLIGSKQKLNRETVVNAIKETDIDAVLVTYLVIADSKILEHQSPINTGYSGNTQDIQMSDTLVTNRGRSNSAEIVGLKNDWYDVAAKKMIWSVRTRTVGPESIDQVVTDVTTLLIDQLLADGLLQDSAQ